jgi:hypothetical protein
MRLPARGPAAAGIRHCHHNDCRSRNAIQARYCRVCGRKLAKAG